MPNGKPGDHPLTDILIHGHEVFGRQIDGLVREVVELGGQAELEREVNLLRTDPRFPSRDPSPDLATLEAELTRLRDRLRDKHRQ